MKKLSTVIISLSISALVFTIIPQARGIFFSDQTPGSPTDFVAAWQRSEYGVTIMLRWSAGNGEYQDDQDESVRGTEANYRIKRNPPFTGNRTVELRGGGGWNADHAYGGTLNQGGLWFDYDNIQKDVEYQYTLWAVDPDTGKESAPITTSVTVKLDAPSCPEFKIYGTMVGENQVKVFWPETCGVDQYKITYQDSKDWWGKANTTLLPKSQREYTVTVGDLEDSSKSYSVIVEPQIIVDAAEGKTESLDKETLKFTLNKRETDDPIMCSPPDGPFKDGNGMIHVPTYNAKGERSGMYPDWYPGNYYWWGPEWGFSGPMGVLNYGEKAVISGYGETWSYIAGISWGYVGSWDTNFVATSWGRIGGFAIFVAKPGNTEITTDNNEIFVGSAGNFKVKTKAEFDSGIQIWTPHGGRAQTKFIGSLENLDPDGVDRSTKVSENTYTTSLIGSFEFKRIRPRGVCGNLIAPTLQLVKLDINTEPGHTVRMIKNNVRVSKVRIKTVKTHADGTQQVAANRTLKLKQLVGSALSWAEKEKDLKEGSKPETITTDAKGEVTLYVLSSRDEQQFEVRDKEVESAVAENRAAIPKIPAPLSTKSDTANLQGSNSGVLGINSRGVVKAGGTRDTSTTVDTANITVTAYQAISPEVIVTVESKDLPDNLPQPTIKLTDATGTEETTIVLDENNQFKTTTDGLGNLNFKLIAPAEALQVGSKVKPGYLVKSKSIINDKEETNELFIPINYIALPNLILTPQWPEGIDATAPILSTGTPLTLKFDVYRSYTGDLTNLAEEDIIVPIEQMPVGLQIKGYKLSTDETEIKQAKQEAEWYQYGWWYSGKQYDPVDDAFGRGTWLYKDITNDILGADFDKELLKTDHEGKLELTLNLPMDIVPLSDGAPFKITTNIQDPTVTNWWQRWAQTTQEFKMELRTMIAEIIPPDTASEIAKPTIIKILEQFKDNSTLPLANAKVLLQLEVPKNRLPILGLGLDQVTSDISQAVDNENTQTSTEVATASKLITEISELTDLNGEYYFNLSNVSSLRFPTIPLSLKVAAAKLGYKNLTVNDPDSILTAINLKPPLALHVRQSDLAKDSFKITSKLTTVFGDPIDWLFHQQLLYEEETNVKDPGTYTTDFTWLKYGEAVSDNLENIDKKLEVTPTITSIDANQTNFSYTAEVPKQSQLLTTIILPNNSGYNTLVETINVDLTLPEEQTTPETPEQEAEIWKPTVGDSFQIQFVGDVDTTVDAKVYDLDAFTATKEIVDTLHAADRKVMCYVNVGAWEDFDTRTDKADFPAEVIGKDYVGWAGEKWLDIRQIEILSPIIAKRFNLCKEKGFDGIEPDNINGYLQDTGFEITADDQLAYNKHLATLAHQRGLSIGLKNDNEQAADLVSDFDWALVESCYKDNFCEQLKPFTDASKAVFMIEYTDQNVTTEQFCPTAKNLGFFALLKKRELDAYREICPLSE